MGAFWQNFGNALGQYEARKSPLGAGLYGGITGKNPYGPDPNDPNNPNPPSSPDIGRYKRGSQPDTGRPQQPLRPGAEDVQPDKPSPVDLKPVDGKPVPLDPNAGAAHEGLTFGGQPSVTNLKVSVGGGSSPYPVYGGGTPTGPMGNPGSGGINSGSWWNPYPTSGGDQGGTPGAPGIIFTPEDGDPQNIGYGGGGYGGGDGYPGEDNLDGFARGGIVGHDQMAKVAESGPEMAGGRIISSPTIVKLNKGEAVIPLTAKSTNKLQPDLLEGHVAAPNPQGVHYSRYKSYGTGRGLMR